MLRQSLHELNIATRGRGFYEFTASVQELVREAFLLLRSTRAFMQNPMVVFQPL